MMTPLELKRFIRFALTQLRDDNAHHAFEEMCLQIGRARISENMIPATGPVGARGDQGRDAESIPRLDGKPGLDGLFGDLADKVVVECCTLQRKGVDAKILADVESICSHPSLGADVVVAFCEENVAVGVRNKLREQAADDHGVVLHVLDGNAIAELLAGHDLNWLARKYLDLPAEAAPTPRADATDAWYLDQRLKWADTAPRPTWGDFEDLRQSLRHAYQQGITADVDLWIELLTKIGDDADTVDLKRSVIYEVALGHLRGHGDLRPVEAELDWFFDTIADVKPSGALEDAQVLLTFCWGSTTLRHKGADPADVKRWRGLLTSHVDAEIADNDNAARAYTLLLVRGALEFVRLPPPPFDDIRKWWDRALDNAELASLLPIERVADRLPALAAIYADQPSFTTFAAMVDDLAADQGGDLVAGELAFDRAIAVVRAGRTAAALHDLHRAKARFVSAHATGALLRSIAALGATYRDLGLYWAAKQHYLAASSIAVNSDEAKHRRFVAIGLAGAAGCDYLSGAWASFLDLAATAAAAHVSFDVNVGDTDEHPFLEQLTFAAGIVLASALGHHPEHAEAAGALADVLLPDELVVELVASPPDWTTDVDRYIANQVDNGVRGFDDTDIRRTLSWTTHGIRWNLVVDNNARGVAAAERFAATLQVLQADLDDFEYAPLPMSVTVEIVVADGTDDAGNVIETGPSTFAVTLAAWDGDDGHEAMRRLALSTFASALVLLTYVSTLPGGELAKEAADRVEAGLPDRITLFRSYDQMLGMWAKVSPAPATGRPPGEHPAPAEDNPKLPWPDGPGPGYSTEAANEALVNRYRNLMEMTSSSLPRLLADDNARATIAELRRRGWLDWHILGAILSVASSYRANRDIDAGILNPSDAGRIRTGPEVTDDPVPLDEFTLEAMEYTHGANNGTTFVNTWKRAIHLRAAPFDALEAMLRHRYRHYDDDIDHPDPFTGI